LRFIHKKLTRERKGSKGKAGRREGWKKGTQRRKGARAQGKPKPKPKPKPKGKGKGKGKGKKGDKKTNQNRA
jgi:hypothetical protein